MTFSSEWLKLREPADIAARSSSLAARVAAWLERVNRTISAVDLGAGTGANVRYMAPLIATDQAWLLVDNNPQLLEDVPASMSSWARAQHGTLTDTGDACVVSTPQGTCRVTRRTTELGALTPEWFTGRSLVTASALLDLVSADWLGRLIAQCRAAGAAVLFALTYDGRITCEPGDADDEMIRTLVNQHQRTDKGFGPALGPDAAAVADGLLQDAGYETRCDASDWTLEDDSRRLQRELLVGWAHAAAECAGADVPQVNAWLTRRLRYVEGGRSRLVVGHTDLAGWPVRTAGSTSSAAPASSRPT